MGTTAATPRSRINSLKRYFFFVLCNMPYLVMFVDLALTSEIKWIILLFYYLFREYSVRQERKNKTRKVPLK